jgi:hypothetical protein
MQSSVCERFCPLTNSIAYEDLRKVAEFRPCRGLARLMLKDGGQG